MTNNSYNRCDFVNNLDSFKAPNQIFDEMTAWNAAQDIIYWKARAVTLEIENAKLKAMIHDIMIPHELQEIDKEILLDRKVLNSSMEQMHISDYIAFNPSHVSDENQEVCSEKNKESSQKHNIQPTNEDVLPFVNKLDEKKSKLFYGPRATRIGGMESALQMNYEQHCKNGETMYWPNIPLNF